MDRLGRDTALWGMVPGAVGTGIQAFGLMGGGAPAATPGAMPSGPGALSQSPGSTGPGGYNQIGNYMLDLPKY